MGSNGVQVKVALIKPPATYADWYKRPPSGIAYLAAYLKGNAVEARIFDAYFNSWSESELVERVAAYGPHLVGLSAMTHEIGKAAAIAAQLKKTLGVPALVGGCHVTALPRETLEQFPTFDYAVYGEGEKTCLELVRCLERKAEHELASIPGLVFRTKEGGICVNEPRPFLSSEELDQLPYPAYEQYYGEDRRALAAKGACYVIFSSRGCPYHCAFCMQVLGHKVRRRSPENVLREIDHAIERYGAHTIDFADEIFLFDCEHTRRLLSLMIERGYPNKIRWTGLTRANVVNEELIALAKQAGCCRLEMGVESGDDAILKAIGKGITVEQVRNAVRIIKKAGIPVGTYFILGHPNETLQSVRKTVDLAVELNTRTIAVGLMVPYPGTRIHDMAVKGEGGYRLLSTDWSQYDKYGGQALQVQGLPHKLLEKWQRKAILNLYLKNFRLLDALRYAWTRKRAFAFFLKRRLGLSGRSQAQQGCETS